MDYKDKQMDYNSEDEIMTDTNSSKNDDLNELYPINKDKYNELLHKENERKRKWNAYMRNYNARKKREHEAQLNKIIINFNNVVKSYDKEDLLNVLRSIIITYTTIINNNINHFPENVIIKIKEVFESNNILNYLNLLNEIVKELL